MTMKVTQITIRIQVIGLIIEVMIVMINCDHDGGNISDDCKWYLHQRNNKNKNDDNHDDDSDDSNNSKYNTKHFSYKGNKSTTKISITMIKKKIIDALCVEMPTLS